MSMFKNQNLFFLRGSAVLKGKFLCILAAGFNKMCVIEIKALV